MSRRLVRVARSAVEYDLDQGALQDHSVDVRTPPVPRNPGQDPAPLVLVVDDAGGGRHIGTDRSFQVEGEPRVGFEVRQPAATSGRWRTADIEAAIDVVKDDFEPPRPSALPTNRRYVDGPAAGERGPDPPIELLLFLGTHDQYNRHRPQVHPRCYCRQLQWPVSWRPSLPVVALVSIASTVPATWLRSSVKLTLSLPRLCHTLVASRLWTSMVTAEFWYAPGPRKLLISNTTPHTTPSVSTVP